MSNFTKSTILPIVYYEYHRKSTPETAVKNICAAFKGNVVHIKRVEEWYRQIEAGEIVYEEQANYGRTTSIDHDKLRQMLEANPKISGRQLARHFGVDHGTIAHHVGVIGMRLKRTWKRRNPPPTNSS